MNKVKEIKKIHFVGIKGMAMSGLALMARQLVYVVTGSDQDTYATEIIDAQFKTNQIKTFDGFSADNLKDKPDQIVVGAAYGPLNIEYKAAKSQRIPILTSSEILGEIMKKFEGVGVAGVHGKTTTSSMLAFILSQAGFSPSYSLGTSAVKGLEANGHIGDGKYFVVEADEYRKSEEDKTSKFFDLPLKHVIITSIELDHPDIFDSAEQVYEVFYKLSTRIPRSGSIVACSDYPLIRRLISRRVDLACLTYGFEPGAIFQLINYSSDATQSQFDLLQNDQIVCHIVTHLPGRYNALNCAAATVMALKLGVESSAIIKAIAKFEGAKRRFQVLGEFGGATVIDDFAHHPTAVKALIEAAKERYPQSRIIAVFQPHTYSRTGKLLKEFAESLKGADKVILLNIFASSREKSGYITIKDLIDAVKEIRTDVEFRPTLGEVAKYLKTLVRPHDVVLLIGAGDVYQVFSLLQE